MTCHVCKGTKSAPMIDMWKSRDLTKAGVKNWKLAEVVRHDIPGCPECDSDNFWGYVMARIEKDGQPFSDGDIKACAMWNMPDGSPCVVLTNKDEEESRQENS